MPNLISLTFLIANNQKKLKSKKRFTCYILVCNLDNLHKSVHYIWTKNKICDNPLIVKLIKSYLYLEICYKFLLSDFMFGLRSKFNISIVISFD